MKINVYTILFGIASIALGAYLNDWVYKRNNAKLLAELKSEIEANNQSKARTTSEEQRIALELKNAKLNAQIQILEQV